MPLEEEEHDVLSFRIEKKLPTWQSESVRKQAALSYVITEARK